MSESVTPRLDNLIDLITVVDAALDALSDKVSQMRQNLMDMRDAIVEIKGDDPEVTPV